MNEMASQLSGLPMAPRKKTHRGSRGRGGAKKSGSPGHEHHALMVKAHAAGKHAEAKTHALNYAKAITQHLAGAMAEEASEPDGMDDERDETATAGSSPVPPAKASAPLPNAKLAAAVRFMKSKK